MNFKIFFRILVIGIVGIFLSASVYADEDHLSISPFSGIGVNNGDAFKVIYADTGKLEVTISGTRDLNEVEITHVSYFVTYLPGETIDGVNSLRIRATIDEGEKSGKSTYEKKLPIYLKPGLYTISFAIYSGMGNEEKYVDMNGIRYLYVKGPIPINIDNITGASITGSDSFKLEGIKVPGNAEKYRGSFKWNPNTLSFDLIDAGVITDETGN